MLQLKYEPVDEKAGNIGGAEELVRPSLLDPVHSEAGHGEGEWG